MYPSLCFGQYFYCTIDYTTFAVSGNVVRTSTSLTTPVGLTAVTPTDRPKSVRHCCLTSPFGVAVGLLSI